VTTVFAVAVPGAERAVEDRHRRVVRFGAWSLALGGGLTVLGVILATALGWAHALDQCCTPVGYVGGGLQASLHVLVLGGFIGLWVSGVCGRGRLALIGVALAFAGHFIQIPAEVVFRVAPRLGAPLFTVAGPLIAIGLVIAGIAAFQAGLWRRWQSSALLAAGLYIPLILIPSFVLAKGPNPITIGAFNALEVGIAVALLKGTIVKHGSPAPESRVGSRPLIAERNR